MGKCILGTHDDVIKWKHFPRYWPFVRGIHRSPVNSPHKGQWRGALMFSLICVWINGWVNNREVGDLRRHRAHYGVTVMITENKIWYHTGFPIFHNTSIYTASNNAILVLLLFGSYHSVMQTPTSGYALPFIARLDQEDVIWIIKITTWMITR